MELVKPKIKIPPEKLRRREENIRMDVKEIGVSMRNRMDLANGMDYWRVLVNATLNHRVP
jgi:hypothetical protein